MACLNALKINFGGIWHTAMGALVLGMLGSTEGGRNTLLFACSLLRSLGRSEPPPPPSPRSDASAREKQFSNGTSEVLLALSLNGACAVPLHPTPPPPPERPLSQKVGWRQMAALTCRVTKQTQAQQKCMHFCKDIISCRFLSLCILILGKAQKTCKGKVRPCEGFSRLKHRAASLANRAARPRC